MAILKIGQRQIPVRRGQSLLEAAEQAKIPVEYQCRNGFCGACRQKLKSGSVKYPNPPLAYCEDDEVLLCCAYLDEDGKATVTLSESESTAKQPE